jgi:glycosyltransferase involved in cell wall biosynthesis
MDRKVFLGFDPLRLRSTFSYLAKDNALRAFRKEGIATTFDLDDQPTEALFFSAEDLLAFYPSVHRKGLPISLIVTSDMDDLAVSEKSGKKSLILTQNAFNYCRLADHLVVFFESQKKMLEKAGIKKDIRIIQPQLSFEDDNVSATERRAFRSFYQIPQGKTVIVAYGHYGNKAEFNRFDSLARLCPDKEFLFFGHSGHDALSRKLSERLSQPECANLHYLNTLPEELYHSLLLNAGGALFIQSIVSYPIIILDLMAHEVPLIAYQPLAFPELFTPETALLPPDFASLYESVRDLESRNQKRPARELALRVTGKAGHLE